MSQLGIDLNAAGTAGASARRHSENRHIGRSYHDQPGDGPQQRKLKKRKQIVQNGTVVGYRFAEE